MSNKETAVKVSRNPFDIFVAGARKGWTIATQNMIPNVLMAFTIAYILNLLGIMGFIGKVFGPVMGIFGVPGEAITILLTAWLSASAGIGLAASLLSQGIITPLHATIMMPACFLMASQLQYMGRLLGVADVPKKYWPLLMIISIFNACVGMLVMRFFV